MCADECAERFLRQPVNDATGPGPIGGAGTHGTGLGARVHGALAEKLRIIGYRRAGHEIELGMAGAVAADDAAFSASIKMLPSAPTRIAPRR